MNSAYLQETTLLNYNQYSIQQLIEKQGWQELSSTNKIKAIYNFVRDDIPFGYNASDNITASEILKDGYGQCNTKATLLMALLRAVDIPNRIHGFTIDKALQEGAIYGLWYKLAPLNILHSWVEVYFEEKWYFLEGVILDKPYLKAIQEKNKDCVGSFCGYGAYTDNLAAPQIDWNKNNTFIQEKGINNDFGTFDTPDAFYAKHQQKLSPIKDWVYRNIARHQINKRLAKIRNNARNIKTTPNI